MMLSCRFLLFKITRQPTVIAENIMERRVLVVFKKDVDAVVIQRFFEGIELLTSQAEGLESFELKHFKGLAGEHGLNQQVSNVIFPDVMTIWKFRSEQHLESFISSQYHLEIARDRFKPAVHQRVVFNC
jgi:Stress responsive A/B Barrel Domain